MSEKKLEEELADAVARTKAWEETARQYAQNQAFYQGIVTQIGELFGDAAKTDDLGQIHDPVLALRVPELVRELLTRSASLGSKEAALDSVKRELEKYRAIVPNATAKELAEQLQQLRDYREDAKARIAVLEAVTRNALKDPVGTAIVMACMYYEHPQRFNTACFAHALSDIAGTERGLESKIVEVILRSRPDVKWLGTDDWERCDA